ncbi:MAG: MFS transporter [Acidimicrobiia bacterium]|nr:MFS transporter [Acidimicrobiia bacterium]
MNRRTLPILLLTFVNALGGTLLIPVLPFVVRDLGQADVVFALLIAAYPAAQFFAAPVLGSLADSRGRRPVLLLSQAGTLVSWLVFAAAYFVDGAVLVLGLIAVSRVVDGLTGGNASVAAAYIVDVTTEEERTRTYAVQGAVVGLALLVGPALGALANTTSIGFLGPALLAIAISGLALVWLALGLDESLAEEHRRSTADLNPFHQLNLLSRMRSITNAGVLQRLFLVQGFFILAFSSYTTIIVLLYADRLGLEPSETGLMLLSVGTFLIFHELVTLRFAQRLLGDSRVLSLGLVILPVALLLLTAPTTVATWLPISFLMNAGLALIMPTLQSAITKAADPTEEGEVQGITTSVSAAAAMVAPVAGGALYEVFGNTALVVFAGLAALAGITFATTRWPPAPADRAPGAELHHRGVQCLAQQRAGGHRSWGLQLHGGSHRHHGLAAHATSPRAEPDLAVE